MALNDIMSTKSILENIANEAKKTLIEDSWQASPAWGLCGLAARNIARAMLGKGFSPDKIKIYLLSLGNGGYHVIPAFGSSNNFDDLWRIDIHELSEKLVYAPGEKYWVAEFRPQLVNDNYFAP